MAKFTLLFVIATLAVCVQALPYRQNDVASMAVQQKWEELSRLLNERIQARFGLTPVDPNVFQGRHFDIKNLHPTDGGHVYGESKFEYHTATNVNGHEDKHSGGHKVINKDGHVTEFDYTPQN
uniref:Seroin transcript 3 n=1 Tax=Tineola bisselliella TaxID=93883 RepID=A0A455LAQ2_TINBI|nr:seroin transcript 3 [Tineola bisselliella]